MCMVTLSKSPSPTNNFCFYPPPFFKMFLERSLNDAHQSHFKHLSLLPPPHPPSLHTFKTFKTPSPNEQLLSLPTPCFEMFFERSLNDPPLPPLHFKHLCLRHFTTISCTGEGGRGFCPTLQKTMLRLSD